MGLRLKLLRVLKLFRMKLRPFGAQDWAVVSGLRFR
jgi:hypothetical protein